MNKTAFIGHRTILATDINERLIIEIISQIQNGCNTFTMGTHGEFDKLALDTCKYLKNEYPNINIEVVITSLNSLKKHHPSNINDLVPYSDVKTVMYEIENIYHKKQLVISNYKMIDTCDTLICYVDETINKSGAKIAMQYAKKKGLKIINLFKNTDNNYRNMTNKDFEELWKNNIFLNKK